MTPQTTKKLIILLILLNLVDLCVTLYGIDSGIAREVNPFMDYFLQQGYVYFILVKLTGVAFAATIFWKLRDKTATKLAISFCLAIYISLNLYFCWFFL
jgi:hypothetical protein